MLNIIIFILILSILVLVHEFGHFYVAKKSGVHVEEFGFGIPPKLFGKKIGDTEYTLNLLPFGGFVRLEGEDDVDEENYDEAIKDKDNFLSKSPLIRAAIIIAGVFMNIVLAIFLYYIFFFNTGFKTFAIPNFFGYNFRYGNVEHVNTVVMDIPQDSGAEEAGIRVGEAILEIDGVSVYSLRDLRRELEFKAGQEVSLLLKDMRSLNKDLRTVSGVKVQSDENGNGILGVYLGESVIIDYSSSKYLAGPKHAYNVFAYSTYTFKNLINRSAAQRSIEPVSSSVSGPIGILSVVGGIIDYGYSSVVDPSERLSLVALSILDLTALLSISLAFINILPFPALDGGRLIFVLIESVLNKRLHPKYEAVFHKIGMLILLTLLILITIRDVGRIL